MTNTVDLDTIALLKGAHDDEVVGEWCLLEAVAYIAGERWSDHPNCVCPVLATFGRAWNDALPDDKRTELLRPFIPKLIGTRATSAVETRRAWLACDWLVRTYAPVWLRAAGLDDHAAALEALDAVTSDHAANTAIPIVEAAWSAAKSAAWWADPAAAKSAAWPAAKSTAGPAAKAAAESAAESAAWPAAWSTAWSAAKSAAWWAAWSAAKSAAESVAEAAAESALAPYVELLQISAVDLYDRMINVAAAEV